MAPRYKIKLTRPERESLEALTHKGQSNAHKFVHARALLLCDVGAYSGEQWKVAEVADSLGVSERTVERLKHRFIEKGLDSALGPVARLAPSNQRFDGRFEARLIAQACSVAPDGRARWTLRLLAQKVIELQFSPSVSVMTVQRTLKKNELHPHLSQYWKIPPKANASFVANMEDVLDLYHAPYDPLFPLVCMDESNKQLIGEVHPPIPMAPGQIRTEDHEYIRNGVADIFIEVEPLGGRRHIEITTTRTRLDWAHFINGMLTERYPLATKVRLVMDNLNTHTTASLYEAFPPEQARRLAERLEIHYTPKHGSWLNIAEIELSVLQSQCLNRRIPDIDAMRRETSTWEADRNNRSNKTEWHFCTSDARIKLKHLYPTL
jgi:transposase